MEFPDNIDIILAIIAAAAAVFGGIPFLYTIWSDARKKKYEKTAKAREVVAQLVEDIQGNPFELGFGSYRGDKHGGMGSSYSQTTKTIFEISYLSSGDFFTEYNDVPVYFKKNYTNVIDYNAYINNSHLPKKIADKLSNFQFREVDEIRYSEIKGEVDVVLIMGEEPVQKNAVSQVKVMISSPKAIAFLSWESFKISCQQLSREIERWSKSNDLSLNIRYS